MNPNRKTTLIAMVGVLVCVLTFGPTILAATSGPPEYVFGGFLLNPIDGATYLAKMFQGWQGDWKFTLPYTPVPGQGAYINLFYIFLGHLARVSRLPLLNVFHLARLVAVITLLFSLYNFLENSLTDPKWRGPAFVFAALASGVGWLAVPFGGVTSDLWVAEMYPFLSAYTTPHFALGLALLLWIITPESKAIAGLRPFPWLYILAAFVLSLISPFGIVVALVVLGSLFAWEMWPFSPGKVRSALQSRAFWVFIAGGPVLLYDLWVVRVNPVLAGWNAQNITPSPPVWDLVFSLSPFLWLAIPGAIKTVKRRDRSGMTLVLWACLGLLLVYLPFSLQRRFLMGLFVPFVALAIIGLDWLTRGSKSRFKLYAVIVLGFTLPTNLVVLLTGYHGMRTHDPLLYMTKAEVMAFQWIRTNTPEDALVLAAPQTGLWIPAQTGRRVVYGHPFESLRADAAEREVKHFYETGDPAILRAYPIKYIFYGPRESDLTPEIPIQGLEPVYSAGGVMIYAAPP
jgi:hypothetical protein